MQKLDLFFGAYYQFMCAHVWLGERSLTRLHSELLHYSGGKEAAEAAEPLAAPRAIMFGFTSQ